MAIKKNKPVHEKKIFEEFLVIGIESTGLEYIYDIDELYMTPRITYNYPNNLSENEIDLYLVFLIKAISSF